MGLYEILAQIDDEISQLKQARAILTGNRKSSASATPKKRNLTPEGRRRIVEAVKRRWALQNKTGSPKLAAGLRKAHRRST